MQALYLVAIAIVVLVVIMAMVWHMKITVYTVTVPSSAFKDSLARVYMSTKTPGLLLEATPAGSTPTGMLVLTASSDTYGLIVAVNAEGTPYPNTTMFPTYPQVLLTSFPSLVAAGTYMGTLPVTPAGPLYTSATYSPPFTLVTPPTVAPNTSTTLVPTVTTSTHWEQPIQMPAAPKTVTVALGASNNVGPVTLSSMTLPALTFTSGTTPGIMLDSTNSWALALVQSSSKFDSPTAPTAVVQDPSNLHLYGIILSAPAGVVSYEIGTPVGTFSPNPDGCFGVVALNGFFTAAQLTLIGMLDLTKTTLTAGGNPHFGGTAAQTLSWQSTLVGPVGSPLTLSIDPVARMDFTYWSFATSAYQNYTFGGQTPSVVITQT